jgi:hypothetical protein
MAFLFKRVKIEQTDEEAETDRKILDELQSLSKQFWLTDLLARFGFYRYRYNFAGKHEKYKTVVTECSRCHGTGIIQSGVASREMILSMCYKCDGTGAEEVSYIPYKKRKDVPFCTGVTLKGVDMLGQRPYSGATVSYEEFKRVIPAHK